MALLAELKMSLIKGKKPCWIIIDDVYFDGYVTQYPEPYPEIIEYNKPEEHTTYSNFEIWRKENYERY